MGYKGEGGRSGWEWEENPRWAIDLVGMAQWEWGNERVQKGWGNKARGQKEVGYGVRLQDCKGSENLLPLPPDNFAAAGG